MEESGRKWMLITSDKKIFIVIDYLIKILELISIFIEYFLDIEELNMRIGCDC